MNTGSLEVQVPRKPREGSLLGPPAATHIAPLGGFVMGVFSQEES